MSTIHSYTLCYFITDLLFPEPLQMQLSDTLRKLCETGPRLGSKQHKHKQAMASGFPQAQNILHGMALDTASLQDFRKQ